MNTKITCGVCVLVAGLCLGAGAAVVPYIKSLDPAGDVAAFSSLTIPAGKVVVFDHMQFTSRTLTIRLRYTTAASGIDTVTGLWDIMITNPAPGMLCATPTPIRLAAGWIITNTSSSKIYLSGLAMDASDLYAGVGTEIDSLNLAGGTLLGGIQLDSPRPVVATVEQSEDMKTWAEDPDASVQKGDAAAQLEFTTTPDDAGAAFRVKARALP